MEAEQAMGVGGLTGYQSFDTLRSVLGTGPGPVVRTAMHPSLHPFPGRRGLELPPTPSEIRRRRDLRLLDDVRRCRRITVAAQPLHQGGIHEPVDTGTLVGTKRPSIWRPPLVHAKRLIVPPDGSASADRAVEPALTLAGRLPIAHAALRIIHASSTPVLVLPPPTAGSG